MTGFKVEARDWSWRHAARRTPAIAGLDFEIAAGERVLLLGPSGAGKSTLLAALAGVLGGADEGDESGELRVNGLDPSTSRGLSGLVLQDPESNTIMERLGDDVAFGCENLALDREEIWHRVARALEDVGLDYDLQRSTSALSGGERQRLALAGVLAMRPGLLLLDEPTANLDPEGTRQVRDAVDRVVRETGATLVVVEHRVETWLPCIDRVIVLEPGGGVLSSGTPEAVLGTHGNDLAERGVWVPGHPIEIAREPRAGASLLSGHALATTRGSARDSLPELHFRAGESSVITGSNGAGKTTLAHTLAGLLEPRSGAVVASPSLASGAGPNPMRWRSKQLLTRIGTVFQQPEHQFVAASVLQELMVGPKAAGQPLQTQRATADRLLSSLRLDHLANANPFTLSGGEKRRLTVGAVLASAPQLIVLDEPTFGQDRTTWRELVLLIAGLVDEGRSVLSITHDPDVVRILGDQVIDLDAGVR
ncbi:ABC transporter ATP-binding protein [Humidisolicoccus flavus]|uniref:ABC transporter ATP-binding protein n=1 Tax=Humidisolicoccus flavus TaxID=3111414 RepID=UPI0032434BF0